MAGHHRGPVCGQTNPSFLKTPGPTGINDAFDPNKRVVIANDRSSIGSKNGQIILGLLQKRIPVSNLNTVQYTGPPYILGKPDIADRITKGFVNASYTKYRSRFDILVSLTKIVDQELIRLGVPLPTIPKSPPKDPTAAGGFSCGNAQKGLPNGLWEIKLFPTQMDLNPYKKPKEFAEQCATIAHEYEHLVDTYYAVMFAVSRNEKDNQIAKEMLVPPRVIQKAKSRPLKINSTEYLQAEEFYWFSFLTRIDRKKSDPIEALSSLNLEYLEKYRKRNQLKRYNGSDKFILDIEYKKILTDEERRVMITELNKELQLLKRKISAARDKYTALPKETIGHIVEEIYSNMILKAFQKNAK